MYALHPSARLYARPRASPSSIAAGAHDGQAAFEGNGALTWRVVRGGDARLWAGLGLGPPQVRRLNSFGYLLSLGFRPGSLLPPALVSASRAFDHMTRPLAPFTAMRAMVVWDRVKAGNTLRA